MRRNGPPVEPHHGWSVLHVVTERGVTLIELMVVVTVAATLAAIAVPVMLAGLEAQRGAGAARYLAARMYEARFEAVKRSRFVALRFDPVSDDYVFTRIQDGNHNGIRTVDISSGIDTPVGGSTRLTHLFAGVSFALAVPPIDGASGSIRSASGPPISSRSIPTEVPHRGRSICAVAIAISPFASLARLGARGSFNSARRRSSGCRCRRLAG